MLHLVVLLSTTLCDGPKRWEKSAVDGTPHRTLVCYKESQSNSKLDPLPGSWTGTFRDARAINPRGPWPENELTGTIFTVNAQRLDHLVVPARFRNLRIWRHSPVAALRDHEQYVSVKGAFVPRICFTS